MNEKKAMLLYISGLENLIMEKHLEDTETLKEMMDLKKVYRTNLEESQNGY